MTKPFDPTKPVQLEDGTSARIICTDRKGDYPIVALIKEGEREGISWFKPDGSSVPRHLVNVPEKHMWWVNIYAAGCFAHKTRENADRNAVSGRIACIRIEFKEGEVL